MPAPVVTRANTVTYGGFAMGGSTKYHIHGVTSAEKDYSSLIVSWQIFLQHDVTGTFTADAQALEAAMRVPNGDLVVSVGGTDWINLSHSSNTGMLAEPSITKAGGGGDSNNTRIYDCSVRVMLPADLSGQNGRRTSRVTLTEDGSEAIHLDVTATYTALGGNDALTQAQAQFPTYTAAQKTAAGGVWDEYAARSYAHDTFNKTCKCSASYRQILAAQSQSGTNDTTLQNVWTEVTTSRAGIGADPGGTSPLVKISVRYACTVRSTVTTDLKSTYLNNVRPHMISIASAYATDSTQMSAISETPGLRPQDNTIAARIVFLAPGDSSLIRADTNVAMIERLPIFFEPVLDGDDYSRDRHNRPGYKAAAVVSTVLMLDSSPTAGSAFSVGGAGSQVFSTADAHVARLKRQNYHVVEKQQPVFKRVEFDSMRLGGAKLNLVSVRRTILMEKAKIRTIEGAGGRATQRRDSSRGTFHSSSARGGGGGWID